MPPFESATPRHALPFLFPGQAQKEFYLNEALARCDALLHCTVEGFEASPPIAPSEGQAWIVAANAGGAWSGRDGNIATFSQGNWLYFEPRDGMLVFHLAENRFCLFQNGWKNSADVSVPQGGSTIDVEARAALAQLIVALKEIGIIG